MPKYIDHGELKEFVVSSEAKIKELAEAGNDVFKAWFSGTEKELDDAVTALHKILVERGYR